MVTILSNVGFHRKAAFLMRASVHVILPLLIQTRANVSAKGEDGRPIKQTGRHDKGILTVLEQICMAHGIECKYYRLDRIPMAVLKYFDSYSGRWIYHKQEPSGPARAVRVARVADRNPTRMHHCFGSTSR
jgi:hypothetical protein